ncbi:hypothetical protein PV762_02495 [Mitsuaria sp. CC2]|uniref:hypothetical protein n=1 Tax=Mitsuaria sp. CC2 TaxID=3029186 RepID=UPI003B8DFB3A
MRAARSLRITGSFSCFASAFHFALTLSIFASSGCAVASSGQKRQRRLAGAFDLEREL